MSIACINIYQFCNIILGKKYTHPRKCCPSPVGDACWVSAGHRVHIYTTVRKRWLSFATCSQCWSCVVLLYWQDIYLATIHVDWALLFTALVHEATANPRRASWFILPQSIQIISSDHLWLSIDPRYWPIRSVQLSSCLFTCATVKPLRGQRYCFHLLNARD